MDDTFAPELEQIFAQHKVDDKIKKYLLGLTPPIATVASFASLVGPDDELATLLFDPAGIFGIGASRANPCESKPQGSDGAGKDHICRGTRAQRTPCCAHHPRPGRRRR